MIDSAAPQIVVSSPPPSLVEKIGRGTIPTRPGLQCNNILTCQQYDSARGFIGPPYGRPFSTTSKSNKWFCISSYFNVTQKHIGSCPPSLLFFSIVLSQRWNTIQGFRIIIYFFTPLRTWVPLDRTFYKTSKTHENRKSFLFCFWQSPRRAIIEFSLASIGPSTARQPAFHQKK